jgi:L-2-hydroxyglutarate oxidase LhgO
MQTDYLIAGGGMTAAAAANSIRERDPDGSITIVSAESNGPGSRRSSGRAGTRPRSGSTSRRSSS